jgi:hypothetical protein
LFLLAIEEVRLAPLYRLVGELPEPIAQRVDCYILETTRIGKDHFA